MKSDTISAFMANLLAVSIRENTKERTVETEFPFSSDTLMVDVYDAVFFLIGNSVNFTPVVKPVISLVSASKVAAPLCQSAIYTFLIPPSEPLQRSIVKLERVAHFAIDFQFFIIFIINTLNNIT
nr:hypothetical protein WCOTENJF_WCOTENJF_CDS_0043 [uncultured phage]